MQNQKNNQMSTMRKGERLMSKEFINLLQSIFEDRAETVHGLKVSGKEFKNNELALIEATIIALDMAKLEDINI